MVSLSPLISYVTSLAPDFTTNLMSSCISDNFIEIYFEFRAKILFQSKLGIGKKRKITCID